MRQWLLLLLLVSTAAAADVGSVYELKGTAVIKRGNQVITVTQGSRVETDDEVVTKNGVVNIKFLDDTTVKITENSSLVIDDFVYDPKNASKSKLSLKAASGTVRYVSGAIAHNNPKSVKINTPTAAIAVRGTDFVMAVDETGKSLIMLMPSCELPQMVNLKGLTCGSGKIDVDSGSMRITLDKPYQATIVETTDQPPLPPVVVNLSNTPIGNNLLLTPPNSVGGLLIVRAAREAANKTNDRNNIERKDQTTPSIAEAKATHDQQKDNHEKSQAQRTSEERALALVAQLRTNNVTIETDPGQDSHVVAMYKNDNPALNQTGWGYMSLSESGKNFAAITMTTDNKNLVIVSQDRVSSAHNFAGAYNRPQGSIVINQTWR